MHFASFVQGRRYHLDLRSYRLGPQKNYKLIRHEHTSPYDNEPINSKDHSLFVLLSILIPNHTFEYYYYPTVVYGKNNDIGSTDTLGN